MDPLFFNGPVQNGEFTFADRPGKVVGIRIAGALNGLLGARPVPHLWNTVRLDGDLRYRRAAAPISREQFELATIGAKYGTIPPAAVLTDADPAVAELAVEIIERRLTTGELTIRPEVVRLCSRCAHMTSTDGRPCRACGHAVTRQHTGRHLVTERDTTRPTLTADLLYAHNRRPPRHLRGIAAHVPARLILSRTRDYGIDLGAVGLPGLVLDPRAGAHIAVLTGARARGAHAVVMTTTANAAANIIAYGEHFTNHDDMRLRYAVHGHVPYGTVGDLWRGRYAQTVGFAPESRTVFETWFLPMLALKEKNGIREAQLPALLRLFHRSNLASTAEPNSNALCGVRRSIAQGNTEWMGSTAALGVALSTTLTATP